MSNLSQDMFQPVTVAERKALDSERIVGESLSFWQDAWRRLKNNKAAMVSLFTVIAIVLLAIFAPMLSSYTYNEMNTTVRNQAPSMEHWLGTDHFGRDLWVRVWEGARISLFIAATAALADLLIGVVYGVIAGYVGGRVDNIMMRIIEILVGIPNLILIILLIMVMGAGIWTMILAMIITGWVNMARLVRGQVLQLKNQEFVLASRTLGAQSRRVMFKHLIPNALGIIIVHLTITIPNNIFLEAILTFIGIGLEPPIASWGVLVHEGFRMIKLYFWQFFFPSLAIAITTLAFNILGDGLRDAFDPKLRQ
ncbi:MAG: ABC transporter permease [Bacillaceae bacterium]|nr:ABC transporter permease [Bacillaceae bacterium]